MIDAFTQAIRLQPVEKFNDVAPMRCETGLRQGAAICLFAIYDGGPGTVFLRCMTHGERLRCTEALVGHSHDQLRGEMNAAQRQAPGQP